MIARLYWFANGRLAGGIQAGQQNAAFHLGTCHRELIIDRVKAGAVYKERRILIFYSLNPCAVWERGSVVPLKGGFGEEGSPAVGCLKGRGGKNPGEQGNGGAGFP